jgi:RHS repeat-associated protein
LNSAGRLISAEDETGNEIQYSYFSSGNIRSISSVGTALQFGYDSYGNRTSYSDPNSGTTTYEYNALGELVSQTDASDNTFSLSYDQLGRIDEKEGPEGNVSYSYVTTSNGFGKISSISAPDSAEVEYEYDALGRTTSVTERTGNKSFTTDYSYNQHGDVTEIQYPSGVEVEYIYDQSGTCTEIMLGTQSIWTLQSLNSSGQPLSVILNGASDTVGYSYDDYGHLAEKVTSMGTQAYSWNLRSGDLEGRSYTTTGINASESLSYDGSSRLTGYAGNKSVTYEANGNISSKTDAGEYSYDATKVNAVTGIDTLGYTAVPRLAQQITYNASGMVSTITQDSKTAVFRYNTGNQRIRMQLFDTTALVMTKYYSGSYEKEIKGTAVRELHYISSPYGLIGVMIKQNNTEKFWYAETDHLGSVTGLYNSGGQSDSVRFSYDAWGRRRNPTDWSYDSIAATFLIDRGFTGHEHLDSFGLINMNGRVYDPVVGRFLSPDPIVQDVENSQSFNSYTYCLNNPLLFTDPSGFSYYDPWTDPNSPHSVEGLMAELFGGIYGDLPMHLGDIASIDAYMKDLEEENENESNPSGQENDPDFNVRKGIDWGGLVNQAEDFLTVAAMTDAQLPFGDIIGACAYGGAALGRLLFGVSRMTRTFFQGAQYSSKVISQMNNADDLFHAFPKSVDGFATSYGKSFSQVGADGEIYQWLRIKGSWAGKSGYFEYTKDANGIINHRLFVPF